MKNLSLILNIILVIAVIVLFYLHFKKKGGQTIVTNGNETEIDTSLSTPVTKEVKSSNIVYVNSDSLWEKYEYVKNVKAELERERKNSETQFESRVHGLEKEYNELKEKAQFMTQEQGMQKQQELMLKEQKLAEYRDNISEKLLKNEQEKNDALQKSILDYMKKNYDNSNYTYILGYSRGGGILYAKDSLDITREVIEGLNKEYKAGKGKK